MKYMTAKYIFGIYKCTYYSSDATTPLDMVCTPGAYSDAVICRAIGVGQRESVDYLTQLWN